MSETREFHESDGVAARMSAEARLAQTQKPMSEKQDKAMDASAGQFIRKIRHREN